MLGITQKCLIVFPQGSKIGESGKFGSLGGLEGGWGASATGPEAAFLVPIFGAAEAIAVVVGPVWKSKQNFHSGKRRENSNEQTSPSRKDV